MILTAVFALVLREPLIFSEEEFEMGSKTFSRKHSTSDCLERLHPQFQTSDLDLQGKVLWPFRVSGRNITAHGSGRLLDAKLCGRC